MCALERCCTVTGEELPTSTSLAWFVELLGCVFLKLNLSLNNGIC